MLHIPHIGFESQSRCRIRTARLNWNLTVIFVLGEIQTKSALCIDCAVRRVCAAWTWLWSAGSGSSERALSDLGLG